MLDLQETRDALHRTKAFGEGLQAVDGPSLSAAVTIDEGMSLNTNRKVVEVVSPSDP